MTSERTPFRGKRLLILGFGSIAATVLPLLFRHIAIRPDQVLVISEDVRYAAICERMGVTHRTGKLRPDSFAVLLDRLVEPGDCILNLTGGVSARDLVRFSLARGIDYLDTSNERWEHGAVNHDSADYAEQWSLLMAERDKLPKSATALVSHGANPGLVSHFAKQAIQDLAMAKSVVVPTLSDDRYWARLASRLRVEALHISERDTQKPNFEPDPREFLNTWSVEGMEEECNTNPCFAWGSHEATVDAAHIRRDPVAVVGLLPGRAKDCGVRSWLPSVGEFRGAVIPHEETFSIAELFTLDEMAIGPRYQPTVLFAYRPCDAALQALHNPSAGRRATRVLIDEIASGVDELGVLVLRRGTRAVYWYGSILDIDTARRLAPFANATSLQVAAGVLGGLAWLLETPQQGLVAAEDADHKRVLDVARPYLGRFGGVKGTWPSAPERWLMRDLLRPVSFGKESGIRSTP